MLCHRYNIKAVSGLTIEIPKEQRLNLMVVGFAGLDELEVDLKLIVFSLPRIYYFWVLFDQLANVLRFFLLFFIVTGRLLPLSLLLFKLFLDHEYLILLTRAKFDITLGNLVLIKS